MKRYELTNTKPLAYEPDYRMVADEDGEYVLYAEAQGRIDELKTALENVRNQERERYADALVACVTSLDAISRELQAVYDFARGRCCTCSGMTEDKYGQRNLYTERCYGCSEYTGGDAGEPNLWESAWEVKS